tara:strand:- start:220 stop:432 length:213 start_codon:yes stop_codon:yes gene_type:complete
MNEHLIADLLFKIKLLESQENDKGRKIKLEDLSLDMYNDNLSKKLKRNNKEKIKDYRQQEEFGEKKFIKP